MVSTTPRGLIGPGPGPEHKLVDRPLHLSLLPAMFSLKIQVAPISERSYVNEDLRTLLRGSWLAKA